MSIASLEQFILKDEKNLYIAEAISRALPETRKRIGETFLTKLSANLVTALPGWKTETWQSCFEHSYATYYLHKPAWKTQYYINLQFTEFGHKILIGIQRNVELDLISARPFSAEIFSAVASLYPSTKSNKWWEGVAVMRSPATDWGTPEVLWRVYQDPTFLNAVTEQMLALAKATEPILDRLTAGEG